MSARLQVAIPSYHRADVLRDKTLSYLGRAGVEPGEVAIFVADEAEMDAYREALPEWADRLLITAPGLMASRRVAQEQHLPEGSEVVWMDDDVSSLVRRVNDRALEEVTDLRGFVEEAFTTTRKVGAYLWGVYATANAYYMKPKVRTDLRHVVGAFYGVINRRDPALVALEYGDAKEDYERTLRHYETDGCVVRFDYVAVKTVYYRSHGGIEGRTEESVEANVAALERRWPGWVKRNTRRRSGYPEILIGRGKERAA